MLRVKQNPVFLAPDPRQPAVPHGLRSSFRDWAAERTNYPREMAEIALAHRMPMICSSVYLVRFMVRPFVGSDSNSKWRKKSRGRSLANNSMVVNVLLIQRRKSVERNNLRWFLMAQNGWILEVIRDMVIFAHMNDLPKSAQVLQDTAEALSLELEREQTERPKRDTKSNIVEFPNVLAGNSFE